MAITPSGDRMRFAAGDSSRPLELLEQGFYELRPLGEPSSQPHIVAVNLDISESDLSSLDAEELAASVASRKAGRPQATAVEELTPEEQERRQTLWWYLLGGALLALAAETVLSNRLSRGGS